METRNARGGSFLILPPKYSEIALIDLGFGRTPWNTRTNENSLPTFCLKNVVFYNPITLCLIRYFVIVSKFVVQAIAIRFALFNR